MGAPHADGGYDDMIIACYAPDQTEHFRLHYCEAAFTIFDSRNALGIIENNETNKTILDLDLSCSLMR